MTPAHFVAFYVRIASHEPEAVHSSRYHRPAAGRFAAVAHARLAAQRYYATRWLDRPPDVVRYSSLIFQWFSSHRSVSGNFRVTHRPRWRDKREKGKSFDFWADFSFFDFSNWFHPIRHPPAGGSGGWHRSRFMAFPRAPAAHAPP